MDPANVFQKLITDDSTFHLGFSGNQKERHDLGWGLLILTQIPAREACATPPPSTM